MFHCGYPLKETEKLEGKKSSPLETRWFWHILAPILLAGHGTTFVCEKTCHFSTGEEEVIHRTEPNYDPTISYVDQAL